VSPETEQLLAILKEIASTGDLQEVYDIMPDCGAPLDAAVWNWIEAGCPDAD